MGYNFYHFLQPFSSYPEVDLVNKILYTNGTLAKHKFPIFTDHPKRRVGTDDKNFRYFLSTTFDYVNEIWKSGFFKIDNNLWDNYGNDDLFDEYPIEGIDLTFECPIAG